MRPYFPHEILKQLDIDYKPTLTWVRIQRDEASYHSE